MLSAEIQLIICIYGMGKVSEMLPIYPFQPLDISGMIDTYDHI